MLFEFLRDTAEERLVDIEALEGGANVKSEYPGRDEAEKLSASIKSSETSEREGLLFIREE